MASSSDTGEKKGTWKLTDSIRSQLEGYSMKCLLNYITTYLHKFTAEAQEEIGEIRFRVRSEVTWLMQNNYAGVFIDLLGFDGGTYSQCHGTANAIAGTIQRAAKA